MAGLLKLAGLDWPVPDSSTPCRRLKTLVVQLPYRGSGEPLNLLVDSIRIKVRREGEWHAHKHGGAKWRLKRKMHLPVDESTLEGRAVEIAGNSVGDALMLASLLSQFPAEEPIASVTADGAHDDRTRRGAISDHGVQTIIPPRRNAKPSKKDSPGARGRNDDLLTMKRFGRTPWRKWSGYQRRSRVETKMKRMKLLGQKLMSRDFQRQTTELQPRVAILNGFTAHGIPVSQTVG